MCVCVYVVCGLWMILSHLQGCVSREEFEINVRIQKKRCENGCRVDLQSYLVCILDPRYPSRTQQNMSLPHLGYIRRIDHACPITHMKGRKSQRISINLTFLLRGKYRCPSRLTRSLQRHTFRLFPILYFFCL